MNPLVLGSGIRLFGEAVAGYAPRAFERTGVRAFDSGVTLLDLARRR